MKLWLKAQRELAIAFASVQSKDIPRRSGRVTIMKWVWYGVLVTIMGTPDVNGSPLVRAGTVARPSPTILSWSMAQWVAPIQGEIYTVDDWHVHLMQFSLDEWPQWMSSRPDAQCSASEWLAFWQNPANRYEPRWRRRSHI